MSDKDTIKIAGGREVTVLTGGKERAVFVRVLSIAELPKLAAAVAANGGLGDDAAILQLYVGPEVDVSAFDDDAMDLLHEAGDDLNMGFLSRFLARANRRGRALSRMVPGIPSPSSSPTSAELPE